MADPSPKLKIAVVGLGNMGVPMAGNLVKAGHEVAGFDLSADCLARAKSRGIVPHDRLDAAVAAADVIITMLPAGRHVRDVYPAIIAATSAGALLIDSSTIDVDSARAVHAAATAAGHPSLDAPVSGGVGGADAATLTFMVGGDEAAFERGKPVLAAMGRRIVHCGAAGSGQAAKICNNMILGVSMIAVAEAFVLAEKLGLSHQALFDVASTASGQCWSLTTYCPVPGPVATSPANRDYAPGFAANLMMKDLALAQAAAQGAEAATPLGAEAAELYRRFCDAGHGDVDFSGIIRMLRGTSTS